MPRSRTTFKKGTSNGRPKGAINKSHQRVKDAFAELLEENLAGLKKDVRAMEAKDRAYFLKELAEYIIPKLARVEAKVEDARETIERQIIIIPSNGREVKKP